MASGLGLGQANAKSPKPHSGFPHECTAPSTQPSFAALTGIPGKSWIGGKEARTLFSTHT